VSDTSKGPTRPATPAGEEDADYYFENGLMVFTAAYHLKRGYCCHSGCRHCPYRDSQAEDGSTAGRNEEGE
jgi:hypothetical protein